MDAKDSTAVARLVLAVLRAGELDSLRWWDDESLTEAGQTALSRLFPRRHAAIAVRLAFEAARARHQGMLAPAGVSSAITLLDLGGPYLDDASATGPVYRDAMPDIEHLRRLLESIVSEGIGVGTGLLPTRRQGIVDLTDFIAPRHGLDLGVRLATG